MTDIEQAFKGITANAASFGRKGNQSESLAYLRQLFGACAEELRLCNALVQALHHEGFVAKVNQDAVAVYDPEGKHNAFYFVYAKRSGTVSFHVNENDARLPGLRAFRASVRKKGAEEHFDARTAQECVEVLALLRREGAGLECDLACRQPLCNLMRTLLAR